MRSLRGGFTLDDEVYRGYRRTIDDLWRYVEAYGIPALKQEVTSRMGRSCVD